MSVIRRLTLSLQLQRWDHLLPWILCAMSAVILAVYLQAGLSAGDDLPLLPVDDVYIHFQYARQLATGEPFTYNSGLPPTSGATSLLYPFVLASGYAIGFQGLSLAIWSLIIGALALALSGIVMNRLLILWRVPVGVRWGAAIAFTLSGAMTWHFMSGMETGLVVLLTFATLYAFSAERLGLFVVVAFLLALSRPEASIMAAGASGLYALRLIAREGIHTALLTRLFLLALPIAALAIQPLLNYALTGSFSASGNQSKSVTGIIPADSEVIVRRIFDQYLRGWSELFSGFGEHNIAYLAPFVGAGALIALLILWRGRGQGMSALLIVAWWGVVLLAIATLDTAFWHFKRYHIPLLALTFPLLALALSVIRPAWGRQGVVMMWILFSLWNLVNFSGYYALNVRNVSDQPLSMARWINSNTPETAVIAVHDVGILRYMGGRTTLDMVGLTTSGAADYWRNGPGAVAEYLMLAQPDIIAAYTTARGLNYLADTDLYGEILAEFTADYDPRYNVALGAPYQVIARADYRASVPAREPQQTSLVPFRAQMSLITTLNVAELMSESAHDYLWSNRERLPGFASEVYQFLADACACEVLDGGRLINGQESFSVPTRPGEPALLITRLHPAYSGIFTVYVDGQPVGTRLIPYEPGRWLEVGTYIPSHLLTGNTARIHIEPDTPGGYYMPYHHWWYQGATPDLTVPDSLATFDETIHLVGFNWQIIDSRLYVDLTWFSDGHTTGDAIRFVHLYAAPDAPPVAQNDTRAASGTLSPANWLPGTFHESLVVELAGLDEGEYTLALGFYDPVSGIRRSPRTLTPDLEPDAHGRLWLGNLTLNTETPPGG